MRRVLELGLTAVVAVGLSFWLARHFQADPEPIEEVGGRSSEEVVFPEPPPTRTGDGAFEERLGSLESQLAELTIPNEPGRHETEAEVPERSELERQQREAAWVEERVAMLDGRLEREPRDPTWGPEAERRLRSAVAAVGAGSTLATVRCGSTMCRFEAVHDTPVARSRFMSQLVHEVGTELQNATIVPADRDGEIRSTGFMSRAGYELPAPPFPEG